MRFHLSLPRDVDCRCERGRREAYDNIAMDARLIPCPDEAFTDRHIFFYIPSSHISFVLSCFGSDANRACIAFAVIRWMYVARESRNNSITRVPIDDRHDGNSNMTGVCDTNDVAGCEYAVQCLEKFPIERHIMPF